MVVRELQRPRLIMRISFQCMSSVAPLPRAPDNIRPELPNNVTKEGKRFLCGVVESRGLHACRGAATPNLRYCIFHESQSLAASHVSSGKRSADHFAKTYSPGVSRALNDISH